MKVQVDNTTAELFAKGTVKNSKLRHIDLRQEWVRTLRDKEIIMQTTPPTPEALIGISTLVQMLQRSRASIYRDIQNKAFPKPLKLGNSSRWKLSEV